MVRSLSSEKRNNFLSAALKLFVAQGVQNTTTAEIARDAGTAAGTLFLYFPTKQELIHELVLQIGQEQSEYIKTRLDPALPARECFFTIWDGSVRWFLDHPDAFAYILQVRDSGIISEEVVRESNKFFDYYYTTIQKGLAENAIKPYPLELIGSFLYQDIVAIMNLIRHNPDPVVHEKMIRIGFDIFWDGIKQNHPSLEVK